MARRVVWFGLVWCGVVWFGLVWFGLVCLVVASLEAVLFSGGWHVATGWDALG